MVQNNKVLTVSYGTFSCTLEGFDDSFETMKAIAEYFRDLAADDRYFGSEPPQPDPEMLARIAQRDASRQVEARQNDSGLLIRATEQATAPQPAASAAGLNVVSTPDTTPAPAQAPQTFFDESEEDTPPPAADSIAAKLQRIRAVVSHSEENSVIYSEDEETTLMNSAGPSDAVAAAFEAGSLNPTDLESGTDSDITEDASSEVVEETQDVAETLPEPEMHQDDEVIEESTPALETQTYAPVLEEEEPEEVDTLSDVLFSDFEETEEEEPEAEDEVNILGDAVSEDQSDELAEPADERDAGILTEEDEINLLSEISNVENILANRETAPVSDNSSLEQDALRLMDQVGEQLDKPEVSDTRETYSHLRAAVAATEAERNNAGDVKSDELDQGFRNDLTSVVSPRRPEIQVTSMRPETVEAAPLKLVAEQRIDNQEKDAGPITPRRVKTDSEDDEVEEGGFAQFAQEQGAQSLPDLLEAAAAYLSFIEGQEQFSRPQLMNKIRSLKQDDFNREESLRSFGQLLRDGKIEKAGGGRFAASTQIGFRPDDEREAG